MIIHSMYLYGFGMPSYLFCFPMTASLHMKTNLQIVHYVLSVSHMMSMREAEILPNFLTLLLSSLYTLQ